MKVRIFRGFLTEDLQFSAHPMGIFYVAFCECGRGYVGVDEQDARFMLENSYVRYPADTFHRPHKHVEKMPTAHVQVAPEILDHFYERFNNA